MITEKEIVKFRGDYYCIGLYRDDYSGNDNVFLRKLKMISFTTLQVLQ